MSNNFCDWELTQLLPEKKSDKLTSNSDIIRWIDIYTKTPNKYWKPSVYNSGNYFDYNDTFDLSSITKLTSFRELHPYIKQVYNHTQTKGMSKYAIYNREAWTWEDVRLYLFDKGIEFLIGHSYQNYKFSVWIKGEYDTNSFSKGISTTYEEARIEAIKYCLNLIKEN